MEKELICICCFKGCYLKVDVEVNKVIGNICLRGVEYGINEVINFVRVIIIIVKVVNGYLLVVFVKIDKLILKGLNFKCMDEINKVIIEVFVKIGDILIGNVFGIGVNIVVIRNVKVI